MPDVHVSWPWLSVLVLGAFHGLNPAMGWLFAVALGFQERRTRAVVAALGPITLGHAMAIASVAVPVGLLGMVFPQRLLLVAIGMTLIGFAGYKVATHFRHPRWVGMRVRPAELILWSFLMATAHGAGLMLAPSLTRMRSDSIPGAMAHPEHAGHHAPATGDALASAAGAVALHSGAMLAVAALIALVVYQKLGVDILRRAWINLDLIWVAVLVLSGATTLVLALWPVIA